MAVRKVFIPRQDPVPAAVPPLLSFAAGFIDSYTLSALFGLFVAQVTGSFVLAAVSFVTSEQGLVIKLLAIPVFLLAAVVTTVVAVLAERRGRSGLAWTLGFECLALIGFIAALLVARCRCAVPMRWRRFLRACRDCSRWVCRARSCAC